MLTSKYNKISLLDELGINVGYISFEAEKL